MIDVARDLADGECADRASSAARLEHAIEAAADDRRGDLRDDHDAEIAVSSVSVVTGVPDSTISGVRRYCSRVSSMAPDGTTPW